MMNMEPANLEMEKLEDQLYFEYGGLCDICSFFELSTKNRKNMDEDVEQLMEPVGIHLKYDLTKPVNYETLKLKENLHMEYEKLQSCSSDNEEIIYFTSENVFVCATCGTEIWLEVSNRHEGHLMHYADLHELVNVSYECVSKPMKDFVNVSCKVCQRHLGFLMKYTGLNRLFLNNLMVQRSHEFFDPITRLPVKKNQLNSGAEKDTLNCLRCGSQIAYYDQIAKKYHLQRGLSHTVLQHLNGLRFGQLVNHGTRRLMFCNSCSYCLGTTKFGNSTQNQLLSHKLMLVKANTKKKEEKPFDKLNHKASLQLVRKRKADDDTTRQRTVNVRLSHRQIGKYPKVDVNLPLQCLREFFDNLLEGDYIIRMEWICDGRVATILFDSVESALAAAGLDGELFEKEKVRVVRQKY